MQLNPINELLFGAAQENMQLLCFVSIYFEAKPGMSKSNRLDLLP